MSQFRPGDTVAMKKPDERFSSVNPQTVYTVVEVKKGPTLEFLRLAEMRGLVRAEGFERA